MNCRRFVLENVGTKEAKGTGRSCPTIPTLLLMATGFPFLESERHYLGTSVGNAGTEDNARCFPSPHPMSNFRTSKVQAILPTVFDRVVQEGNTTSFKVS